MENLLPHYNIYLESTADQRSKLQIVSQFLREENTLDIQPSAKVAALVEESVPKIISLIRQGEIESMQREQAQREFEQQQAQQQIAAQQQMQEEKIAHDDKQAELNRQNQIKIAEIRALGGVQTDANKDSALDAQQNLDNFFKQQEMADDRQANKDNLTAKRQSDIDKLTAQREKNQTEIEKEKIKAQGNLAVAKENRTAAELKKKQQASNKKKKK